MEVIGRIDGGFGCKAGIIPGGWFAGVLVPRDFDGEYVEEYGNFYFKTRDGKSTEDWKEKQASVKRKLILIKGSDVCEEKTTLSEAERIGGVAVSGAEKAAVAWTERKDGKWRFRLWTDDGIKDLAVTDGSTCSPSLAWAGDKVIAACCSMEDVKGTVTLYDGDKTLRLEGRTPRLAGFPDGSGLVILERCPKPEEVELAVYRFKEGEISGEIKLPQPEGHNFNCETAVAADGAFYATWTSCPSPGSDERAALYRELSLWVLRPGAPAFEPAPGTCNGFIRTPREAFLDSSMQNLVPMYPQIFFIDGAPALAYKRYTLDGHKGYGWDTYMMAFENGIWTEPLRISAKGHADTGYSVLQSGGKLLGFFPKCESKPTRPLGSVKKKWVFGEPMQGNSHASGHRVEIIRFEAGEALEPMPVPDYMKAFFVIPPPVRGVAAEPPDLPGMGGLRLIWGDMHSHSCYSKCQTANDGFPRDVLRFERDILGCRVLCLSEHVEYLSSQEFNHVLDSVELEAGGGNIPLYAVEKNVRPSNHTIFYAIDREVFNRFRGIALSEHWRAPLYRRIKEELPPGSLLPARHMHGVDDSEFGVSGPRNPETHDPELEFAMEALQGRLDMMLNHYSYKSRLLPYFPSNFLNGGAKIGLVGGTDHVRGRGANKYGLTGFWVSEVTPEAVFDAIKNRRTIAAANGKIAIYAEVENRPMGSSVKTSFPVRIKALIGSARTVRKVCLIRDGEVLEWINVGASGAMTVELTDDTVKAGPHWYVVTAQADSYYDGYPAIAHASPVFTEVIENG